MNLEDNNLLDKFLSGNLTKIERDAFVQRMEEDEIFRNEVNFEIEMRNSLDSDNWNFIDNPNNDEVIAYTALLKDDKTKKLKESINQARLQYKSPKSENLKKWVFIAAAACIIFIVSMKILFNDVKTGEQLYTSYYDATELPSLLVRSNNDTFKIDQIQLAFETKNYSKTIELITDILLEKSNEKSTLLIYKGISHVETNNAKEAKETFNQLINSNLVDAEKGYWYMALLYLKTENKDMAKKTLQKIASSKTYKHQKAAEILKKLK